MGLFDSLFGGGEKAAREAAAQTSALYNQYGTQGRGIFGDYGTQAGGALTTGLNQATSALGTGQANTLNAYQQALNSIQGGQEGALAAGRAGVEAYTPLSNLAQQYGAPVSSYYDALGLRGQEGVNRVKQQFTTSPSYQFEVDEAMRALTNRGSQFGNALSGNTLQALQERSGNLARTQYGNYLDRLAGFVNPQLQATAGAASGIAGANRSLADIYGTGGAQSAGIYGNMANAYGTTAGRLSDLYSGTSQNQANIYGNVAQGLAGIGRDVTGGQAQGINQVANAKAQDTANYWNFLGNLAGGVSKAFLPGK